MSSLRYSISLNGATSAVITAERRQLGVKPERNEAFRIAGKPARLLTYHFTRKGDRLFALEAVSVSGGRVYDVYYLTLAGTEKADRTFFLQFVSTFGFGA